MPSHQCRFRPLITSLSFRNSNQHLPLRYNYSLQQIQAIKKYIPKNLFKINGIDIYDQSLSLTRDEEQQMQRMKLKIKASKGKQLQSKKQIQQVPKQQVKVIQWYQKCIDLRIPYNSKQAQVKIQASIFEHISYYLQNFMMFKSILTEEIYKNNSINLQNELKLTTQQIATQTDIVFLSWNIEPQPNDNQIKIISLNIPIAICLRSNQNHSIKQIKSLIKADIANSLSIMLKHKFNFRVFFVGNGEKQFVCLNSYCNQQNAKKQQDKLRTILKIKTINQQTVQTQQSKQISKKQYKFLLIVLMFLMVIYVLLKMYPLSERDRNQYIKNQNTGYSSQQAVQINEQVF